MVFVLFFRDTFRRERSLAYQNALGRRTEGSICQSVRSSGSFSSNSLGTEVGHEKVGLDVPADLGKDVEVQRVTTDTTADMHPTHELKVSLRDVNPFKPFWLVLRRPNNIVILIPSGTSTVPLLRSHAHHDVPVCSSHLVCFQLRHLIHLVPDAQ